MKFNATSRSVQGTSASRRLRHAGRVPAIVYGGTEPALNIELDHNEIYHALRKGEFHASILDMNLEGGAQKVLLRAVQWHPYKQQVLHVDFQRVDAKHVITMKVPLHFINGDSSPAVKLGGAMLSQVQNELEVTCLPANLPQFIEVDLGQMIAGEIIHLADIRLPKGVTVVVQGGETNPALVVAMTKGGAATEGDAGEADEAAQ